MLRLEHEFLNAGDAKGDEVRATWGRLAIHLGNGTVTRCIDRRADSVRSSVYGPLYPVAEWFAANWWSILYELDNGTNSKARTYPRRHDLQLGEQGFALPRLVFQSIGQDIRISSFPFKHPAVPIEFTPMEIRMQRDELIIVLSEFIELIANRLATNKVKGTALQNDWNAVRSANADEQAFCMAAAQLGFDPYDLPEKVAKAIEKVGSTLPKTVHQDVFALAATNNLNEWVTLIGGLLKVPERNATDNSVLANLRTTAQKVKVNAQLPPYAVGYARAEKVRSLLNLNGDLLSSHVELLSAFSLDGDEACVNKGWQQQGLRGVLAYSEKNAPVFVLNDAANERSQRFAMSRAIHEHLFRSSIGPRVITEVRSVAQSINRSFAAELLVPKRELSKRIKAKVVYGDQVDALADEFGVESDVIRYHIKNHKLAEVDDLAL
jgi:Zn-dependent peptidase ImmA (M78 family)